MHRTRLQMGFENTYVAHQQSHPFQYRSTHTINTRQVMNETGLKQSTGYDSIVCKPNAGGFQIKFVWLSLRKIEFRLNVKYLLGKCKTCNGYL